MKFIRDLISRKSPAQNSPVTPMQDIAASRPKPELEVPPTKETSGSLPDVKPLNLAKKVEAAPEPKVERVVSEDLAASAAADAAELLEKVNAKIIDTDEPKTEAAAVNIWDMDGEEAVAEPEVAPSPRRRRNQTRLLGFDTSAESNVTPFDAAAPVAPTARAQFPVGWVLVTEGPGRGECFTLEAGMSQIGRGEDQAIQLDFGDNAISRVNHAAIVYDTETHTFMLGHGGKKNVVRLNGTPVISNEPINSNDDIKIGETTLRFIALCNEEFNWSAEDGEEEDGDDVAIA